MFFEFQKSSIESPVDEEGETEVEDVEDEITTTKVISYQDHDFIGFNTDGNLKYIFQFENYTEVHHELFSPPPKLL